MNYTAEGTFSTGLKIYRKSELIFYSTTKNSWFSGCLISIFDKSNQIVVKVREKGFFGSNYKVKYKCDKIIKQNFTIKDKLPSKTIMKFENDLELILNRKWIQVSNPISKIFLNNDSIGTIKMKIFSLEKNYEIDFLKDDLELNKLAIILFLIAESNNDPDFN